MIYCFDLDSTLCNTENGDYSTSVPIVDRIREVNKLFDEDHTIIIDTARGSVSKIDWLDITKKQLEGWGLKYHQLRVGVKAFADVYVDDKAITDKDFFKMNNIEEDKSIFNKKLHIFKDINKDKDAVLMCTGNSVKKYVPIMGDNVVYAGVNRIYDYPDLTNLLDYYFFGSHYEIDSKHKENIDLINPKIQKFASTYRDGQITNLGNITPESAGKINALTFECGLINFTNDIANFKMLGHSIVFPALQFLLYTGVKKIYLVGSDISGFYDKKNEEHLLEWWTKFKVWVEDVYPNVEIVCVNPIGLNGMFKEINQ